MEQKELSNEIFELASRTEQISNANFFLKESLEDVFSRASKAMELNSFEELQTLAYDVSRILNKAVSFTTHVVIETEEMSGHLYVISDQIKDMERTKKKP